MFKTIKPCFFALVTVMILMPSHALLAADAYPEQAEARKDENMPETYIPFANNGGVFDWKIVNENTVLIQDIHRKWYKAKVQGFIYGYGVNESIGFSTSPNGTLERLSTLIIRGRHYPILSLTRTDPPPKPQKSLPKTQPDPNKQEADSDKVV